MLRRALDRIVGLTTRHTRITLLAMLLASAVVLAGVPQLDTSSSAGASPDAFDDLDRVQALQHVQEHYLDDATDRTNRSFAVVYARDEGGNVLSKDALLTELRYQQNVTANATLQSALHGDGVVGISNLVATRAADGSDPSLTAQIRALEDASAAEVETLVAETLAESPLALRFLPADHDPSDTTATDRRLLVALDTGASEDVRSEARLVLHRQAEAQSSAGLFTVGEHELAEFQSQSTTNLFNLVLPLALLVILFVLAFSYRDLVDIVVGMTGVLLSVLWMVGLLGWLGVSAGTILVVPIVLVTGLSIDFGFHVFNRYRERRDEGDPVRDSMREGVSLVATALLLVTATAAIGFLANLANPLPVIRNLGVSITLGVVSSLVIFATVVPALKIGIDGLLERVGFDRRKAPIGHGNYLAPLLSTSVRLARVAAPAVVVLAVVVGGAGGLAWTALDEESYQNPDTDVAQWKQDLPEPMGWDVHEYRENSRHVEETYQPASEATATQSWLLVNGSVTHPATLERIHAGTEAAADAGVLVTQPGTDPVRSPVTAMRAVAERNDTFAAAFRGADTDGNGVPDTDLRALYDEFYAAAPDAAERVLERRGGEYRTALVTLSLDASFTDAGPVVADLVDVAETMERGDGEREVTVAGWLAANEAVLDDLTDGVLLTMLLALLAIFLAMVGVFRVVHGSASLGGVVAVPIAVVIGLVVGGMYLLGVPLTLLTALLMSLVVGLGIDYNIHVGDRFADELHAGASRTAALRAAVTGTGGALLGSTLTSAGAFAAMVLVPSPQLQSFGVIVVLALVTAFAASVLVLPSLLWLWSGYAGVPADAGDAAASD